VTTQKSATSQSLVLVKIGIGDPNGENFTGLICFAITVWPRTRFDFNPKK
jgi:hypothetical protein